MIFSCYFVVVQYTIQKRRSWFDGWQTLTVYDLRQNLYQTNMVPLLIPVNCKPITAYIILLLLHASSVSAVSTDGMSVHKIHNMKVFLEDFCFKLWLQTEPFSRTRVCGFWLNLAFVDWLISGIPVWHIWCLGEFLDCLQPVSTLPTVRVISLWAVCCVVYR